MSSFKLAKPILAALTACAVNFALGGAVLADTAQDNAQLKEQMRIMMQQMQEMQKQIQDLKKQQQQPPPHLQQQWVRLPGHPEHQVRR